MKWIEKMLIADYGKKQWNKFTEFEKIDIVTSFLINLNKVFKHEMDKSK